MTDEHVEELRKLIEHAAAEKTPDMSKTGIIFDEKLRAIDLIPLLVYRFDLLCISAHGAELEAGKLVASEGFALVCKKEWATILEPNRKHNEGIEGRSEGKRHESEQNIKSSLLTRSCKALCSFPSRSAPPTGSRLEASPRNQEGSRRGGRIIP
jgi:hypothetical protein